MSAERNKIDLDGLCNNPTPYRVYQFFYQGGGYIGATPYGLVAKFRDESDAKKYADERTTPRNYYRIVNEKDLP